MLYEQLTIFLHYLLDFKTLLKIIQGYYYPYSILMKYNLIIKFIQLSIIFIFIVLTYIDYLFIICVFIEIFNLLVILLIFITFN